MYNPANGHSLPALYTYKSVATFMPTFPEYYAEMSAIISRFAEHDGQFPTAIGNLFLTRRSLLSQPLHTAQWPCFVLVTQGTMRLILGEEVFDYGVGDCLMVSLDLPVVSLVTQATPEEPHLGLGMAIDSKALQEVLKRINLRSTTPLENLRGVAVHQASLELLDATLRLLRLIDRPEDIAGLAPLIEQEILYLLLTGPYGARMLRIAANDSPGNKIAKAITWLREHYARPLRIEELAHHVGMSQSSLHHHFSAMAAMTPMQYQKRLRLHEARKLLLIDGLDVATAGYQVGYQTPSQFSREYRRLYGLSPLHDVDQARQAIQGSLA